MRSKQDNLCNLNRYNDSFPESTVIRPNGNKVIYHSIHSPYIFGRSPRMYASNVLLSTDDQSRSRLSFSTLSRSSPVGLVPVVFRTARSPVIKRCPKSGQSRDGSKGFHLCNSKNEECTIVYGNHDVPEVVEVIRVSPLEETIKAQRLRGSTILKWGIEKVPKSACRQQEDKCRKLKNSSLSEVGLGWTVTLIVLGI